MLANSILAVAVGVLGLASAQMVTTTSSAPMTTSSTASSAVVTTSSMAVAGTSSGAIPSVVSGQPYPYTVAAGSVPTPSAAAWCDGQRKACPMICGNSVSQNTCYSDSLTYQCECAQGPTPNMAAYNGTLLFFECLEYRGNCAAANTMNLEIQQQCLTIQCGGKDPADALAAAQSSRSAANAPPLTSVITSSMSTTSSSVVSPTTTGAAVINYPPAALAMGAIAPLALWAL